MCCRTGWLLESDSVIFTNALHGKGDHGEGGGCPEY